MCLDVLEGLEVDFTNLSNAELYAGEKIDEATTEKTAQILRCRKKALEGIFLGL